MVHFVVRKEELCKPNHGGISITSGVLEMSPHNYRRSSHGSTCVTFIPGVETNSWGQNLIQEDESWWCNHYVWGGGVDKMPLLDYRIPNHGGIRMTSGVKMMSYNVQKTNAWRHSLIQEDESRQCNHFVWYRRTPLPTVRSHAEGQIDTNSLLCVRFRHYDQKFTKLASRQ